MKLHTILKDFKENLGILNDIMYFINVKKFRRASLIKTLVALPLFSVCYLTFKSHDSQSSCLIAKILIFYYAR